MNKYTMVFLIAVFSSPQIFSLTLEQFLARVQEKHRGVKSVQASQEAADSRRDKDDGDLSPVLSMSASYVDDKKTNGTPPSLLIPHQQIRDYSLGLSKKFSTGTQTQVTANAMLITQDSLLLPGNTFSSNEFGIAGVGFGFQQSLWKDAFGRGIRTRMAREQVVAQLEKDSFDLQLKQILIESEAAYWDLIYLQEELGQRQSSLERARKIESWVKSRFNNGIGDKADVLNAQGLVAAREFQLISAQDELAAARKKIGDMMELSDQEKLPEFVGDLDKSRSLLMNEGDQTMGRIIRLDSYLAVLEAKAKALGSEEAADGLKPDLVLQGSYKTNAFQDSLTGALNRWTNTDSPTASVGVKLTWLLDSDFKGHTIHSAKMDALAAALKKERKLMESDSAWSEINRRNQELGRRISQAEKINQIQSAKAKAERDKLSKGRSITSQVITAEQDAAEAELTLAKLKTEQRKLEAQGRLFVKIQE